MIKYRPCPTLNVYIPTYKNVFKCIWHKSIFKDLNLILCSVDKRSIMQYYARWLLIEEAVQIYKYDIHIPNTKFFFKVPEK